MKTTKHGFYGSNPFKANSLCLLSLSLLSGLAEAKEKLVAMSKRNLVDVAP